MRPRGRQLSLKVERCLIDQASSEDSGLDDVTCQRAESGTRSSVNRQNSSNVKT